MCQPGTQRHARILNKGVNYGPMDVTTSNKYLQIKMDVILVSIHIEPCSELFHVSTG